MSSDVAVQAYDDLTFQVRRYDGVAVRPDGLYVYGRLFAFLLDDDLIVELPLGRMGDLEVRGQVQRFVSERHPTRDWVRVSDRELWTELAREAHEYVGEPSVGGES
jgi:hypothetical protein